MRTNVVGATPGGIFGSVSRSVRGHHRKRPPVRRLVAVQEPSEPPPPPPPPAKLVEVTVVVLFGTGIWFVLWLGLLLAHLVAGRPMDVWFNTTLVGWLLGLIGYSVFRWQRWASRSGRRGAQRGID